MDWGQVRIMKQASHPLWLNMATWDGSDPTGEVG